MKESHLVTRLNKITNKALVKTNRLLNKTEPDSALLTYNPINDINQAITQQKAQIFEDFLSEKIDAEQLMYVRNFPNLYEQLPEPKKQYLQFILKNQGTRTLSYDDEDDIDIMNESVSPEVYNKEIKKRENLVYAQQKFLSRKASINSIKVTNKFKSIIGNARAEPEQPKKVSIFNTPSKYNIAQAYNKLVSKVKKNINYRIGLDQSSNKTTSALNSKLLNNLKCISQDLDPNQKRANSSQKYYRKQVGNLIIIHEQKQDNSHNKTDLLNMRNNNEYKTQRPLFKKYFDENVQQFFYKAYTGEYPNQDPLDIKNQKPELIHLEEIADLENFEKDHMIENLTNTKEITHDMMRRKNLRSQRIKEKQIEIQKKKQSLDDLKSQSHTMSHFKSPNTSNFRSQNIGSANQNFRSQQSLKSSAKDKIQSTLPSSPQSIHSQKLNLFKSKGFNVIGRNQSNEQISKFNDMVRSESNDSCEASMVEDQLGIFYEQAIHHKDKLAATQTQEEGLIKRLKHILQLDGLKKNIHDVNLYKFTHKI